jgi:hypothetical protein
MILKNKWFFYSALALIYGIVFAIYTFPLVLNIDTQFIGKGDVYGFLYQMFNFGLEPDLKYYTTTFYPEKVNILLNSNVWTLCFWGSFFENKILAMNLFVWLSYILSAVGAFVFAKKYLRNDFYAFLCGFVFSFSAYKMARLEEHINLVITMFVPFFMYFFTNLVDGFLNKRGIKWIDSLLFIVFFLLSVLSDYVMTICGIYFLIFYAIFPILSMLYQQINVKRIYWILGSFVIIVVFDQLIQFLRNSGFDHRGGLWGGADLASMFIPYNSQFFDSTPVLNTFSKATNLKNFGVEQVDFLGYSVFVLLLIAILIKLEDNKNKGYQSLIFCLTMMFLVMMPQMIVFGKRLFFSPTAIVHFIPFINQMRAPIRVIYVLVFLISIFSFYKIENSNFSSRINVWYLKTLIFIILFLEFIPSKYFFNNVKDVPEVYHKLGEKRGESVLIYPFGVQDGFQKVGEFDTKQMYYFGFHKKKMMGGYLSRVDQDVFEVIKADYFLNTLCVLETEDSPDIDFEKWKESSKSLKVDYLLIPEKHIGTNTCVKLMECLNQSIVVKESYKGGVIFTMK